MVREMQQLPSSRVPHAGVLVADYFPQAKYIPVELPFACWLAGGGCWCWFTVICVMRLYNAWLEEEKKLAGEGKVNATCTLEVKQTGRFRSCKQNFIITCPCMHWRAYKTTWWVWMLQTWDTVWDEWLFAPCLRLCFYAISKGWWFSKRMFIVTRFVWHGLWYPVGLGWWMGWKVVELLWPISVYLLHTRVYQLLWWLLKFVAAAFLHFLHVMTYIHPLAFSEG